MRPSGTLPAIRPLALAALFFVSGAAVAADPDVGAEAPVDADVADTVRALARQMEAQQQEIERLRNRVWELELAARGRGLGTVAQSGEPQPDAPPTGTPTQAPTTQDPATPAPDAPPIEIGQARREEDEARREEAQALVVREHAPLFERTFTLDVGTSYSYYDRRQLALSGFLALDAIFLGTINLDQSKASVFTTDLTGRYGLTERLNVEATVPYVVRDTRFVSGGAGGASTELSEVHVRSSGVGDASVAAYYHLVKESQRWPDIVGSLRVRGPTGRHPFGLKLIQVDEDNTNLNIPEDLPTGTGVWSATANVSVLRTYDPVILFGNLGYTWHKPQDFDDISPIVDQVTPATVELGNTIQVSGGLAVALNDRSAVSFSVSSALSATTHTQAPGEARMRVPGSASNATTLNIGATYALPSGWTFNGQLSAGLTPDAPNFVFGIRATHAF